MLNTKCRLGNFLGRGIARHGAGGGDRVKDPPGLKVRLPDYGQLPQTRTPLQFAISPSQDCQLLRTVPFGLPFFVLQTA
jgi:hypothetical protein